MKIIYIANIRIPTERAHGIQIMKTCEAFGRLNYKKESQGVDSDNVQIELVVPRRLNRIKEDPFNYYEVSRSFHIKKIPCLDLIILDKYIGNLGMWIESASFNFFIFFYILFKKADIFYTRDKFLLPFVFIKNNFVFEAHIFPRNSFLYLPFIKKIKKIIVITDNIKKAFVKAGISGNKILVAPDGVDMDKFDIKETKEVCREKLNLPKDKKIILYAGHLYKWKGVQALADATEYFSEETVIYFVGGTKEDVEKFKAKNYKKKIKIIGHRPYAEIPFWLRAADVLVLPNTAESEISKYWTSPIKMFEYMASHKPIVASNLPSIKEILNQNNAILVNPDDPKAIFEGVNKILQDFEFSAKITSQAFQDVKKYIWKERSKNILNFIKLNLNEK